MCHRVFRGITNETHVILSVFPLTMGRPARLCTMSGRLPTIVDEKVD